MVWEGQVIKANFKAFRVEPARTADVARKLLKDRGCEHYWDMSYRYAEDGEALDLSMFAPPPPRAADDDDDDEGEEDEGEEEAEEAGEAGEADEADGAEEVSEGRSEGGEGDVQMGE